MLDKNVKNGAKSINNNDQNNSKDFMLELNELFLETLKKGDFPIELITSMNMNKE